MSTNTPEYVEKLRKIQELEQTKKMMSELPHLYGQKFYSWSREFFDSTNKMLLLIAGNQLGKSSVQIRKMIHWATAKHLWPHLWKTTPSQFWYLYPSLNVATAEFENKWVKEFLPRGDMKNHPQYGWKEHYKHGQIDHIRFFSGVRIYFHAYSKDVHKLQAGTVHYMATDEELPERLYGELQFRMKAVDGYFSMVFTATMGQEFWFNAMEKIGRKDEAFPNAHKIRATAYDCLEYEDGDTETPWTKQKIFEAEASCQSENERLKRVMGRFVSDEGRKYPTFSSSNVVKPYEIPKNWLIYSGVDIGGGGMAHKAAFCFVAVSPDFQKGAVFKGWKGNSSNDTTCGDILDLYRIARGNLVPVAQKYDWASKEFFTYSSRLGETFCKAEKGHDVGEATLNTLFKLKMLDVFDIEELQPLILELNNLLKSDTEGTRKRSAKDDASDSLRYAVTDIPWDVTSVVKAYEAPVNEVKEEEKSEVEIRREMVFEKEDAFNDYCEEEINEFNDLY